METITKVKEIDNEDWLGYDIMTTKQIISVYIENCQLCCESYDTMLLPTEDIIGLEVKSVKWGTRILPQYLNLLNLDIDYAVVNIETDKIPIQVVAWNDHNGYYPHNVYVEWEGYSDTQKI
jgi:hypothetical protein